MSSKIVFQLYNYTPLTLQTNTQGAEHIENNADGLNDLTLTPLAEGDVDNYVSATITVTTGDHDGAITLNFLDSDSAGEIIARLRCTDLKNPENPGVLIPTFNEGFELTAVGFRSVNKARLIEVYVKTTDNQKNVETATMKQTF